MKIKYGDTLWIKQGALLDILNLENKSERECIVIKDSKKWELEIYFFKDFKIIELYSRRHITPDRELHISTNHCLSNETIASMIEQAIKEIEGEDNEN